MNSYEEVIRRKEKIKQMGGPKAVERQHKSGKWTARERIDYFFDPGTFTEVGMFVKHRTTDFGMDKKDIPADGIVVGYGRVNGKLVMIASEDYTSMAGTFGEYHGKKFSQAIDMAVDMGIPFVGMNDSSGARLQEGIIGGQAYCWLFRSQILASGIIPQIALLMGPCLGGQAYHPVMQDFVFQCKNTGFLGIAGPAFVKAQLGEEVDIEALCGVESQAVKTGQTHLVVDDDRDCLDKTKEILNILPPNNQEKPPVIDTKEDPLKIIPELDDLAPEEIHIPFDMHEVILRIVDNDYFFEILKDFAPNAIIGFARFAGRPVGIVANQSTWLGGVVNCDAADKIARFVRFCDLFNIPVVTLEDTPGYMIGSDEEWKGILRHGAKMLYAYVEATVPKITVVVRKSYAGTYAGMSCKDTGADFMVAWPNARVTTVSAETAASVIFAKEIAAAPDPEQVKAARFKEYRELIENSWQVAERGYLDDIIMPRDTRRYINMALDVLENKKVTRRWKKYSNINL
ncbi:MAG TPA: methylmalonyl-CoA carboxyltransferase [Desulfotomaculum sp.]|jgi:acetyl-CoA carboxylase carboxyltransferase component|nr:methylmalonyl-CoA carboxyltransferase [Desulfotomaculum sp.]